MRIEVAARLAGPALGALIACGGQSERTSRADGIPDDWAPEDVSSADRLPSLPTVSTSAAAPPRPTPPESPAEDLTVFDDPGCPEPVERIDDTTCDPLGSSEQCPAGFGCYPYVDYPSRPCDPERTGTRCDAAGSGTQGDPCDFGGCAHGFLCVTSGQGTACAELCPLPGASTCAPGFICGSVDIQGYGVCF